MEMVNKKMTSLEGIIQQMLAQTKTVKTLFVGITQIYYESGKTISKELGEDLLGMLSHLRSEGVEIHYKDLKRFLKLVIESPEIEDPEFYEKLFNVVEPMLPDIKKWGKGVTTYANLLTYLSQLHARYAMKNKDLSYDDYFKIMIRALDLNRESLNILRELYSIIRYQQPHKFENKFEHLKVITEKSLRITGELFKNLKKNNELSDDDKKDYLKTLFKTTYYLTEQFIELYLGELRINNNGVLERLLSQEQDPLLKSLKEGFENNIRVGLSIALESLLKNANCSWQLYLLEENDNNKMKWLVRNRKTLEETLYLIQSSNPEHYTDYYKKHYEEISGRTRKLLSQVTRKMEKNYPALILL